jgi:endonuclease/exonuclease/phosphatase family metal-dependent hydrolase
LRPGADRGPVEACIQAIVNVADDSSGLNFPDILMIQEMQQCSRQIKRGDCKYHSPLPESCSYDHAAWTQRVLLDSGYAGSYHRGRVNTVGLYYASLTWENVTSPTNGSKMLFVTFGPHGKGAVLAVLRHRVTRDRVLAVAVHLSVPMVDGATSTERPLAELVQLGSKIEDVMTRHGYMPLILAGDLNSLSEATYEALHDKSNISRPDVMRTLTTEWGLSSAYASVLGPTGAAYSSVAPTFRHCIDHILTRGVEALAALDVNLAFEDVDPPYPSDHLPMAVVLKFSDEKDAT